MDKDRRNPNEELQGNDRLDSWKEIATYLDRAVRTVQLWEREEGLPVHRRPQKKRGAVFAYRTELDAWWANGRKRLESREEEPRRTNGKRILVALPAALLLVAAFGTWYEGPWRTPASSILSRRAPQPEEYDLMGRPSQDGRYLSYANVERELALYDLVTEQELVLTRQGSASRGFTQFSAISPDGSSVVYGWYPPEGSYMDIRVIDVGATEPRILIRGDDIEDIGFLDWSLDGRYVLTHFVRKDYVHIMALISVADGEMRVVKRSGKDFCLGMSLSPDGRYLAFDWPSPESSDRRDIRVLDIASGDRNEVVVTTHPAHDVYPLWTPDGERILFGSDRTATFGVWMVEVLGGEAQGAPVMIQKDIGRSEPLGLTRDGAYYYYRETGIADAYTAGIDPGSREITSAPSLVATRYTGSTLWAEWSPDGRYLARTSIASPDGAHKVVVRAMESGDESEFSPDLRHVGVLRWAGDGRSIFIRGSDERRRPGLFRFHLATAELETILLEPVTPIGHSRDGGALFYAMDGNLIRHDLVSGRSTPIEGASGRAFKISFDGRQVAFSIVSGKTWRLVVMPTSGGVLENLLESETPVIPQAWTPDGDALLFTRHDDEQSALWWISTEGGAPQRTGLAEEGLREVRIHPSGDRISFVAGNPTLEVWVMENFLPPS